MDPRTPPVLGVIFGGLRGYWGFSRCNCQKKPFFTTPCVQTPANILDPDFGGFLGFRGISIRPPSLRFGPKIHPRFLGDRSGSVGRSGDRGGGGWGRGVPNRGKNAFYRVLFWCKSTMRYNQGSPKNGLKKGFFDPQTPPENPPIFGHFLDHPSDPRSGLLCRNPKIWETGSDRSVEGPCGATPNWETESDRSVRDA